MGKKSRREYLLSIRTRYKLSKKDQKKKILDEFCLNCGYTRKYAIRILNQEEILKAKKKILGRPKRYDSEGVKKFLLSTWKASNLVCSRRLKALIENWLPKYLESEDKLSDEDIKLLKTISAATIDRIFKPIRSKFKKHGLSTTKPGSIIKEFIPIRTNQWDENRPGYLEADTVAHCGSSISGMFAYTVNMIDIATGWNIQRAVWGKGEAGVLEAIRSIEITLPFKIKGFDCDNGSEFLNWDLIKYFKHRSNPVDYTRSRPYHKNDNAHVEGKNWTVVRQYLGYDRFDNPESVKLMNELYTSEWYYFINFFLPSSKLVEKLRIGSKIVKKHDKAKTPLERLMLTKEIGKEIKQNLNSQYKTLNPYKLQKQIQEKIKNIFALLKS